MFRAKGATVMEPAEPLAFQLVLTDVVEDTTGFPRPNVLWLAVVKSAVLLHCMTLLVVTHCDNPKWVSALRSRTRSTLREETSLAGSSGGNTWVLRVLADALIVESNPERCARVTPNRELLRTMHLVNAA